MALLIIFFAVTSALSAEIIAVSSVMTYDVYLYQSLHNYLYVYACTCTYIYTHIYTYLYKSQLYIHKCTGKFCNDL
jgi:hypothetical protein